MDTRGKRFRFRGVNWYGASDSYHVVGGLDVQCLEVICSTVRDLGFNVVRLCFSNEMLRSRPAPGSIDLEKNPGLEGLSALEVFDEVVRCLGRHSIAVVLNNHTTYGEWCGGPDRNGLWFHSGSEYTEERWLQDWEMLATRYRQCPHVVGYDLRNEVRFNPWPFNWPCWGAGCCSRTCCHADWAEAAATCARRALAVGNPKALIVVERIVWPATGLQAYALCPGPLLPALQGQLVLAAHVYAWSGPGRYVAFATHMRGCRGRLRDVLRLLRVVSPENYGDMGHDRLVAEIDRQWGFAMQDIATFSEGSSYPCPVWISEFGTGPDVDGYNFHWFERFVKVLASTDADYAYWPLNVGPKPRHPSAPPNEPPRNEPYGMLELDWTPKPSGDPRLQLMAEYGLLPS